MAERSGTHKNMDGFKVPDEAIGCGFHEAVRACFRIIRDT